MNRVAQLVAVIFLCGTCIAQARPRKADRVPDEKTAVRIAESTLSRIYGKKHIESERPFQAQLEGNVWVVSGYLPTGWVGGIAIIRIDKRTGNIHGYSHTK